MSTTTHCPYCSLQCGMRLSRPEGSRTVEVSEWAEFPVNKGAMCRKGFTSAQLLRNPERLTTPLIKDEVTGEYRGVSWDEALDFVGARLADIREEHGADAIGIFGGGGLTNEKSYQLGKFARVAVGTSQIDYNGRWCMSSAANAGIRAFGVDRGLPFPLADIEETDVLVLVGSNMAETMPPAARHLSALREKGGKVIVIDPRKTSTATNADVVLQPVPGSDLALAQSLLHLIIGNGHVDEAYVAERTTGWDAVKASVMAWWPERGERVTGITAPELREVAEILGTADKVTILTARGAEQQAQGADTVVAWINIALALGMPGKQYAGYGCLTGQGNGQGGREHGQKADQLPGYRMIDDPAAREHVAGVWGIDPATIPGKGRSAYELLDALGQENGPKALLVFGSNIIVSAPNANHVGSRLDALDLLVVCDMVMSETAARADVILPITQWAEESGTMTNLEGRVILRQRAITPPAGVRSDLEIISGLAERLKSPIAFSTDAEEIFGELGRASAGGKADYSGITWDLVAEQKGVFWPAPAGQVNADGTVGTERLFADRFFTPDGRANFIAVEHGGPAEEPDAEFPLYLTTGRVLAQYQSGAQTRRIKDLPDEGAFVELHPMLARRIGVVDGMSVTLETRRGAMVAPVRVTATIRQDTVFVPFHWVGANKLTNDALDPYSRMPEFKVCAARISTAEGAA